MGMACDAVCTDLVLVVGRVIIGVVAGCGVAGLTNAVPRLAAFIKGEVIWALLENSKVKGTGNVPCFFSDETYIESFYPRVGIDSGISNVGVVTGTTVNDRVSAIYQVICDITHACCLSGRIVAVLTNCFLLLPPGNGNFKHTVLGNKIVAVTAEDAIVCVMRGDLCIDLNRC
jgi:hypothetical protein